MIFGGEMLGQILQFWNYIESFFQCEGRAVMEVEWGEDPVCKAQV